jgi:hypothetical protein
MNALTIYCTPRAKVAFSLITGCYVFSISTIFTQNALQSPSLLRMILRFNERI